MSLSSAFKTVPIELLLRQHDILTRAGSLPTMCLCAFLVASQRALEFGESHLFLSLHNYRGKRLKTFQNHRD
jgi:hypothetical protein